MSEQTLSWFVKENRRAATRHRYYGTNARIGLEGFLTRQCQVLDLSRTGVRLAVANADDLPNTFTLFLSKNSGRSVRVKWRRANEIGAEFFTATRLPAPSLTAGASSAIKPRGVEGQKSKSQMATVPLQARSQQQDVPQVKADARAVVVSTGADKVKTGSISGDKAKIGSIIGDKPNIEARYQIADVSEQLDRANQEKDSKKGMNLSRLQKRLGPDHVALIHALKDVDPESLHGQELASIIKSLDETCD